MSYFDEYDVIENGIEINGREYKVEPVDEYEEMTEDTECYVIVDFLGISIPFRGLLGECLEYIRNEFNEWEYDRKRYDRDLMWLC